MTVRSAVFLAALLSSLGLEVDAAPHRTLAERGPAISVGGSVTEWLICVYQELDTGASFPTTFQYCTGVMESERGPAISVGGWVDEWLICVYQELDTGASFPTTFQYCTGAMESEGARGQAATEASGRDSR